MIRLLFFRSVGRVAKFRKWRFKKTVKTAIKQSQTVLFRDLNVNQIDTYRSGSGRKNTPNTDQDSFYDAEGVFYWNKEKYNKIWCYTLGYDHENHIFNISTAFIMDLTHHIQW